MPDDPASTSNDGHTERGGLRELAVRSVYSLLGVLVIGLGAAVLEVGGVGVDPYTALNIGVSERLGWSLGTYQLLSNAVLFVPMLLWGRRYIGIGSVINMVITGFAIDVFTGILEDVLPAEPTLTSMILAFVVGVIVFAFGASAYMSADVGTAPYDAITPMIVDRTRWEYRWVRLPQDVLFVALGFLVRGPVGVGTVMTAFFNGPLIQLFARRVHEPLVARVARGARA